MVELLYKEVCLQPGKHVKQGWSRVLLKHALALGSAESKGRA